MFLEGQLRSRCDVRLERGGEGSSPPIELATITTTKRCVTCTVCSDRFRIAESWESSVGQEIDVRLGGAYAETIGLKSPEKGPHYAYLYSEIRHKLV